MFCTRDLLLLKEPKKDGHYINCYLDRNLFNRLSYYADEKGQIKTLAIERILKEYFDKNGVPAEVPDTNEKEE